MEKAGRGSVLMIQQCRENGLSDPEWKSDERLGVTVTFRAPQVTPQVTPQVEKLLAALRGEMSRGDLMVGVQIKDRKHFTEAFIKPALEGGLIEMTLPDKPNSSKQQYRLTTLGKSFVSKAKPAAS